MPRLTTWWLLMKLDSALKMNGFKCYKNSKLLLQTMTIKLNSIPMYTIPWLHPPLGAKKTECIWVGMEKYMWNLLLWMLYILIWVYGMFIELTFLYYFFMILNEWKISQIQFFWFTNKEEMYLNGLGKMVMDHACLVLLQMLF